VDEDAPSVHSSQKPEAPKVKRPRIDKQTAYLEFKSTEGKQIEENILVSREEIKEKRVQTKFVTQKINTLKKQIDTLKERLDKKEEERKLEARVKNNEELFEDDDMPQDLIIDEEELMMLKEVKELKRDYRENYSTLKVLKQEINNTQETIDTSKE